MNKSKQFDCIKFKEELQNNLIKKSGAENLKEYVSYVNKIAKESSLHKPNKKEFALKSFKDGKITLVQGANICNMNIYDFISYVSEAGISIMDYSIEEIDRELVQLNGYRGNS